MENGLIKWGFVDNEEDQTNSSDSSVLTVRGVVDELTENLNQSDHRPLIHLGQGDPSSSPCFRISSVAEDAIVNSLRSSKFNGYSSGIGILPARRAVADYLSRDLPYQLSSDDVYITVGAHHAIEIMFSLLARPGANILLPRPGYPHYEARAAFSHVEIRHFDLLPEKGWEVDLDGVAALADSKTVAIVIINPGNPCGNVFKYEHLKKVAETARKLGILVIADEVYHHLAFGKNPFVPMGVFGSIVPVLTIGSISKRWMVPGWRLGWIATTDPNRILLKTGIVKRLKDYVMISSDAATFTQGAVAQILGNTTAEFFTKTLNSLKEVAGICYDRLEEIPCIICPYKPEGAMSIMVKLNLSLLEDITDDMEFCIKLAKEETMLILPGVVVGMKNWIRVTFAAEPSLLEDGLARLKAFCLRHSKK